MKYSLDISNFLEEISSLSHSIVFLHFFALITYEGFLISPCYSLELCIQMGYLSSSPSPLASLLFSAIGKASSDKHFAFLHVAATWMDLDMMILCEVSQTEKDKWHMTSLICGMSFKNDTHKLIYQTGTDSETSKTNVWLSKGKHG